MLPPDGLYRTYQPHRHSNKTSDYSSTPTKTSDYSSTTLAADDDNTAGVLGLTAAIIGLGYGGVMLAAWIIRTVASSGINHQHPIIIAIVAALGLGASRLFYIARQKRRDYYAYFELGAAIAVILSFWMQPLAKLTQLPTILGVLSGIYIAVRGFDNLDKYYEELKERALGVTTEAAQRS